MENSELCQLIKDTFEDLERFKNIVEISIENFNYPRAKRYLDYIAMQSEDLKKHCEQLSKQIMN